MYLSQIKPLHSSWMSLFNHNFLSIEVNNLNDSDFSNEEPIVMRPLQAISTEEFSAFHNVIEEQHIVENNRSQQPQQEQSQSD